METITLLTRLCKIRDTLKKTTELCGVQCYNGMLTVAEVCAKGNYIVAEEDYKKLFAEIKETLELVDDAIRHAARDLTEEDDFYDN